MSLYCFLFRPEFNKNSWNNDTNFPPKNQKPVNYNNYKLKGLCIKHAEPFLIIHRYYPILLIPHFLYTIPQIHRGSLS